MEVPETATAPALSSSSSVINSIVNNPNFLLSLHPNSIQALLQAEMLKMIQNQHSVAVEK